MIGIVLAVLAALGGSDPGDFAAAERAYRDGRFTAAYALFQSALSRPSAPEGPLLFNLGNCAYRLGRHAEAALLYRRARLRMPLDPAVDANLRLAERQLGLESTPRSRIASGIAWLDALPPSWILLALAVLQTLGLAGLILVRGAWARVAAASLVVLALLAGGRLAWTSWLAPSRDGVVLTDDARLRAEPHASLPVFLRFAPGERLTVAEWSDRWARVEHARGAGWVPRAAIGLVE